MMKTSIFLLPLALLLLVPVTAQAEIEIRECGAPPPAVMETDPGGHYCNIYSRQMAYGTEDAKFRKLLKERQKNFGVPGNKAAADYREALQSHYGFDKPEKSQSEEQLFGPPADSFDGSGLNP